MFQLFPSLGRNQELGVFCHLFCTELQGGEVASECVLVHCLCSWQPPTWCPYLLVLRFKQDRSQSLWRPLKSLNIGHMFQSSLSLLKDKPGVGNFLQITLWYARGRSSGGVSVMNFPTFMQLVLRMLGVQEALNRFLDFLQRGIIEFVSLWGKEGLELPILSSS